MRGVERGREPSLRRVILGAAVALGIAPVLLLGTALNAAAGKVTMPPTSGSPGVGSPLFDSFENVYDGDVTTRFTMNAHVPGGAELVYTWELQHADCARSRVFLSGSFPLPGSDLRTFFLRSCYDCPRSDARQQQRDEKAPAV